MNLDKFKDNEWPVILKDELKQLILLTKFGET